MSEVDPIRSQLDAYLDGLLGDDDRRAFEARLKTDEPLRREVELQRRIDERLTARMTPPERIPTPMGTREEQPLIRVEPSKARGSRWIPVGALAALLLLSAVAWFVVIRPGPGGREAHMRHMAADSVYNLMRRRGFEPEWKCETDAEFIAAVESRLGFPALVREDLPELAVVGWAYADASSYAIVTGQTMILICRVEGDEPVLVFVDRLEDDRAPERRPDTGLHLHRRELGELVLYELTPLDEPRVLPRFTIPGS